MNDQLRDNMNDQLLIKILRWLMKPKVWRFVGFASAVVGLLCYALSSSFNRLFGEWTFLKVFLYCIFSLIIISFMIMYAKIWRHTRSIRFKAHMALLVLATTSIYSFFSDKVMNGKPDVYSLISSAAFAIMSLSLSRQSQCGFEVEFLYFFLGWLIVQLMKIKLQLAIVGVSFSYCLVILRSSLLSIENEYTVPQDEHQMVIDMDSLQLGSINLAGMMQQLETCVKALQQENSNLMIILSERAEEYLEGKPDAELVTDDNYLLDALPSERVNDLHETVKLMVGAGHEKECSQVYISWRREFLQVCVINKLFGLGEIDIENEPKSRKFVDMMIGRWFTASGITLRILFPNERLLSDRVFTEFSSSADRCFTKVCRVVVSQLLNFADAFVDGSPSVWRLFKILHMFKALQDLIPQFQSLFPASLVNDVIAVKNSLGKASRDLFMELDKLIFRIPEAKQFAAADGRLHKMTVRVMRNVSEACMLKTVQQQILQEYPNGAGTCSFTAQMEQIIKLLERKLVKKSKIYKDPALRCVFMMNNRRHMEAVCKAWELETIFGNDWFRKNREQVLKNLDLFQRSPWNKVLDMLKLDGSELMAPDVAAVSMKEKLNLFNISFKEMSEVQSTWFVYDKKIREVIITSLEDTLLRAYGIFIGRFQDVLGKYADEYIEYGMFDIQDRINNLFSGGKMNQMYDEVEPPFVLLEAK